jgi:hypothetical protein
MGIKCGTDGDKMCLLMNEFFRLFFYAPNANEVLGYAKFGCWYFWLKYGKFAKFCPFLRSYWSLEFNAQIAGNGISGVLILKIFGGHSPKPP